MKANFLHQQWYTVVYNPRKEVIYRFIHGITEYEDMNGFKCCILYLARGENGPRELSLI